MARPSWPLFMAAFLSLAVALVSYRFLLLGLDGAFESMVGHLGNRRLALLLHVSAAPVALALGVFSSCQSCARAVPPCTG